MKTFKKIALSLAVASATLAPSVQTMAGPNLNIATNPLLLAAQAPANVYWMIDDSGSMDWEVLAKGHFPSWCYAPDPRWVTSSRRGGCSASSFEDDGDWYVRKWYQQTANDNDSWRGRGTGESEIGLIFSSSHNWSTSYSDNNFEYENDGDDDFDVRDWRGFSSSLNTMWYDPTVNYIPWAGVTEFATPASFTAAREDARFLAGSDTRNLGDIGNESRMNPETGVEVWPGPLLLFPISESTTGSDSSFTYVIHHDTHGWTGTVPDQDADDRTLGANGMVDMWDEYTQVDVGPSNTIVLQHFTWRQANGYSDSGHVYNNGVRGIVRSPADSTPTPLTGSAQDLRDYLSGVKPLPNKTQSFSITGNVVGEAKQNIANWFQYYRKRILTAKAAVGQVMVRAPGFFYGLDTINQGGGSTSYMAANQASQSAHDSALLDRFYRYSKASNGGTPLRTALNRAGQFYKDATNGAPIKYSCQPSFTVLMSDGYRDGDGYSNTLADVAYHYYHQDLRGLANNVPASEKDPRTDQHMVTFTVAFGLVGNLTDNNNDDWPDQDLSGNTLTFGSGMNATTGAQPGDSANWGDPSGGDGPGKIDDMWHAAWNSHGIYKSAGNPAELITALGDALSEIEARSLTSSGVAASGGALVTGSALYQPSYDTENWSGNLVERPLDPATGNILTGGWDATNGLKSDTTRTLVTMKPTTVLQWDPAGTQRTHSGDGVPFRYANLSPDQRRAIDTSNATAADKIRWLRGDRAMEEKNGGLYRNRPNSGATDTTPPLLGDIVDSTPIFVGLPSKTVRGLNAYQKLKYADFLNNTATRNKMVYVGANDGIMHGFNADTGSQDFGYIPNLLMPKLSVLTNPTYSHEFFVNTTATVEDVYTSTVNDSENWRTVLVSGLGQGGQGLFALDVTNPSVMSEAGAGNTVLWEYGDETAIELTTAGFVYGYNVDGGVQGSYGSGAGINSIVREDYGSASVGNIFGPQPVAPVNSPTGTSVTAVVFGNGYNSTAPDVYKNKSPSDFRDHVQGRLDWLGNTVGHKHPGAGVPDTATPSYGYQLTNSAIGNDHLHHTVSEAFEASDSVLNVKAPLATTGSNFEYNIMTVGKGTVVGIASAALMVVDAGTGRLVKKIPVVSPQSIQVPAIPGLIDNGLSTPVLYDVNGDGRVDYAYAGDLHGNLWKFNLTDTDPSNWHVEGKTANGQTLPFFVGLPGRPVITRPTIIENTDTYNGGVLVSFGTGKFIETIDKDPASQTEDQYYYSVWDKLKYGVVQDTIYHSGSNLLAQYITSEQTIGSLKYRTTTDNAINWNTHVGWKILLRIAGNYEGERVVNHPIVRNGRVIFTTFSPNVDPCAAGGSGWLMELNAFDGGPIDGQQPFDVNGDGIIDINDITATGGIISGISQTGGGFVSMPTIVEGVDGEVEFKYSSQSGGDLTKVTESPGDQVKGRQSWRYLLRK